MMIVNVDCVEGVRSLESDSVPLVVTSPPYDQVRDYSSRFDFPALAKELWRVTVPGGVIVWVVADQIINGNESGTSFRQALHFRGIGFRLQTMIFDPKSRGMVRRGRYSDALQFMFVLSKGIPRTFRPIMDKRNRLAGQLRKPRKCYRGYGEFRHQRPIRKWGRRGGVWSMPVGYNQTTKDLCAFDHPALMPEPLARDHIISWSKPGELVLDPFAGAGTTLKMAALFGRKFLGFEINAEYCRLAERRVREAISKMVA